MHDERAFFVLLRRRQDVSAGTHWLEVVCTKYAFDPVTIHVSAKHNGRANSCISFLDTQDTASASRPSATSDPPTAQLFGLIWSTALGADKGDGLRRPVLRAAIPASAAACASCSVLRGAGGHTHSAVAFRDDLEVRGRSVSHSASARTSRIRWCL